MTDETKANLYLIGYILIASIAIAVNLHYFFQLLKYH